MTLVREAVERLRRVMGGESGLVLVYVSGDGEVGGLEEHVLVRRSDLELLLATWGEKKQ